MFTKPICLSLAMMLLSSCASAPVEEPTTGDVTVIEERIVTDEDKGTISIQTLRLKEIAERSVADKGSEALMTPQRFANIGLFFGHYAVGKKQNILLSIVNQEATKSSDIWIMDKGKIRLTKTNYNHNDPSFAADDSYVYFSSDRGKKMRSKLDRNSYIWRMASNGGGGLTRIGSPSFQYVNPKESPDGTKILYSALEYYKNSPFIWYMQKDGSLPTQLTQGEDANWLDDETIIFSSKDENTGLYTIWTVNIDGSMLTQFITDSEMDCIQPTPDPSGKTVAYVMQLPDKQESRDVYVFRFENGLSQQLTTNKSRDDLPQWSADGKYLYFRSTRGVSWNIWRLSTGFLDLS